MDFGRNFYWEGGVVINFNGVYLPDNETHLVEWMKRMNQIVDGKPTYQYHKLQTALKYVKNWRTAVDVGGHAGLWSMHLAKRFDKVHAYEPVAAHRDCFVRNCDMSKIHLHACALGDKDDMVSIHTAPTSSGDSWVNGKGDIPQRRLDDNLAKHRVEHVDFIKVDCEGFELFVLRGGEETIKRCKPCIIVEQKPGHAVRFGLKDTQALDYLTGLGAKQRAALSGDFIFSWD